MSPATATFCMFFFDAAFVAVLLPLLLLPFFLSLFHLIFLLLVFLSPFCSSCLFLTRAGLLNLPQPGERCSRIEIVDEIASCIARGRRQGTNNCSVLEWADFDGENETNAEADGGYGICCRNSFSTENQCLNSHFFWSSTAKQTRLEQQQKTVESLCSV